VAPFTLVEAQARRREGAEEGEELQMEKWQSVFTPQSVLIWIINYMVTQIGHRMSKMIATRQPSLFVNKCRNNNICSLEGMLWFRNFHHFTC
jgi:hypothetical protein